MSSACVCRFGIRRPAPLVARDRPLQPQQARPGELSARPSPRTAAAAALVHHRRHQPARPGTTIAGRTWRDDHEQHAARSAEESKAEPGTRPGPRAEFRTAPRRRTMSESTRRSARPQFTRRQKLPPARQSFLFTWPMMSAARTGDLARIEAASTAGAKVKPTTAAMIQPRIRCRHLAHQPARIQGRAPRQRDEHRRERPWHRTLAYPLIPRPAGPPAPGSTSL